MNHATHRMKTAQSGASQAQVVSVEGARAWVRPAGEWASEPLEALLALPPGVRLVPGDDVVVTGLGSAQAFVLARLGEPAAEAVELSDGTAVELMPEGQGLCVRRADGQTLFEYRLDEGGVLTLRGETVRLESSAGGIELESAGKIRIAGREIESSAVVGHRLQAGRLQMQAESTELRSREIDVQGKQLSASLERARLTVRRIETAAEVIVEQARNVYRKVRELCQLRAGRTKTIVDGTAQLKAERVAHRSRGSYKVRSDDIQLG